MKRSAFFILSLILFLNIFAPIAQAATDTYRPTLDESGQCVHGSLAGDYDDYGWSIFIGNDQFDTAGGIRFPNITIDQAEIINDANLTVYYPGGFDWNTGTLYLMIYGYNADDAPRDLTWSDIVNGPRTDSLTVFNMSLMNTTGSYVIDVTDHVQEIVNRYNWESGNAIAFTTLHILEDDAGEYWYEWASNTGAYKNHRPSLTIRHGESEGGPGGNAYFVGQHQGYDVWHDNNTVPYYGLAGSDKWVNLPITVQDSGGVDREPADTQDTVYLANGDYGEIFGNETYNGNFYDQFFDSTLTYNSITINRCHGVLDNMNKVMVLGLERTWGTQVASKLPMAYIASFAESYSGTWTNRGTNAAPIVGTMIRSFDDDEVTLECDVQVNSGAHSTPDTLKVIEGRYYVMNYMLLYGLSGYGGKNYLEHYHNRVFSLNETTGEIAYLGHIQIHFNYTQARYDALNRIELNTAHGGSSAFDLRVSFYTSRGFIPERDYSNYCYIYDENGTLIDTLPEEDCNYTDIKDRIDDLLNKTDPENPAAGSQWTGTEPWYIDRQRTQLYFTILGLGLIIPPWIIAVQTRRIDIVITAIFLNLIGVALLYGVSYI